jgi:lysozyme
MTLALEGIDVSGTDDGAIDWDVYRQSGRRFAFARANYKLTRDVDFAAFWPAMRAAGLVRGAYLFWDPIRDPVEMADAVWATVTAAGGIGPGDFPICVDVESKHGLEGSGVPPMIAIDKLSATVDRLEAHMGVPPMIYTSRRVWREDLKDLPAPALARCPLWAVRWSNAEPECPPVWGPGNWWLHQYAGDTVGVPGVARKADLDRFHAVEQGADGPLVAFLQSRLGVGVTGVFDVATSEAVREVQETNGLVVDGKVGPITWSYVAWLRGP